MPQTIKKGGGRPADVKAAAPGALAARGASTAPQPEPAPGRPKHQELRPQMQTQGTAVPAGQSSSTRGRARMPQIAYTVAEFAELLGKHPNTVYEWIRKGLVPYERIGSTYFIPERTLGCLRPPATAAPLAAASPGVEGREPPGDGAVLLAPPAQASDRFPPAPQRPAAEAGTNRPTDGGGDA